MMKKEGIPEVVKGMNIKTPKNNILAAPSAFSGYNTRRNYHPRENKSHRNIGFSKQSSQSNLMNRTISQASKISSIASQSSISPIKEILSTVPNTKRIPLSGNKTMGVRNS